MTRRYLMSLTLLLALADAVAAGGIFLLVSVIRFESSSSAVWSVGVSPGVAAIAFAALWLAICWLLGLYRLHARWSLWADARDVIRATTVAAAATLSLLFLLHQDDVSRLFLAMLFVVQPVSAILLRAALRARFDALGRRGRNPTYMLIAGTGKSAESFANQLERHPALGIRVIGHLAVPTTSGAPSRTAGHGAAHEVSRPILGSIDQMHEIFRDRVVDEVGVCLDAASSNYLEPVVAVAADEGKTVRVPRDPEEGILRNAMSEEFEGLLIRSVVHDGQRELERVVKRVFDVLGAVVAIVTLSPFWIGTAILIRLIDGSPVLFRQTRIGRHGRPFTIYKFRTMSVDAEDRFAEVAVLSDTEGAAFKMADDPRITPLGRTLRKWTLDELPQLFNVLAGDMSLVGPRPAPPREVAAYDIWHRRRLSVRPGMTGLWQVGARFDRHFNERAEIDLRYIDDWSIWGDLEILARTIPAILLRQGK